MSGTVTLTTSGVSLGDFGPLVVNTDVDQAVISTLRTWMPVYLAQVSAERHLPKALPAPRNGDYVSVLESQEFLDQKLPTVAVTSARTQGTWQRFGDGTWAVMWRVVISCIIRGRNRMETRTNASLYEGTVRRILQQKGSPSISEVVPIESGVQPIPDVSRQGRYLAAGMFTCNVAVDSVVQDSGGPTTPDSAPYLVPIVDDVTFDLQAKPPQPDD